MQVEHQKVRDDLFGNTTKIIQNTSSFISLSAMCFYRNYTPEYTNWEEFTAFIFEEIKKSNHNIFIRENRYPYNCKNTVQDVVCDHRTIFYTNKTDMHRVKYHYDQYLSDGYTIQEVPMEEKSIKIPHFHAIKLQTLPSRKQWSP